MDSRREFLKKAALLTSGAGMMGFLPEAANRQERRYLRAFPAQH
jgi:hypothetical protein